MDRKQLKIHKINRNQLWDILSYPAPRGLFLAKSRCKWVAVDNSTGDAWTEEFPRKCQAVRWLRGKFEVGYMGKSWTWISGAQELVAIAQKQGIALNVEEADTILGYLEGHEYSLMTDGSGATVRHDDQYGNIHRGDEPYTVQDAIEFSLEMNEDLQRDFGSQDEGYLAKLQEDEQVLSALMERITASYRSVAA